MTNTAVVPAPEPANNSLASRAAVVEAQALIRKLAGYRQPDHGRSWLEIAVTALPLAVLWATMWLAMDYSYWLTLALAFPAAGFLVRMFMIQHDCGHGAFFRHRALNDWVGRAIGVLTLTPYDHWRRTHNTHHATSGNLTQRGTGDITTLTVREYLALSRWGKLRYRLYRHPFVLFGIGPAYLFILEYRLPIGFMRQKAPWLSTMTTNGAIVAVAAALIWLVGLGPFLLIQLPITVIAASIGGWLFYVQHQFEETVWAEEGDWNMPNAALHGSSHYDLPGALRWFTANIGIHHIHHLCSRIPFYRLPQVLRDHPQLREVGRLSLVESLGCLHLALWDERLHRLISFKDMRRQAALAV